MLAAAAAASALGLAVGPGVGPTKEAFFFWYSAQFASLGLLKGAVARSLLLSKQLRGGYSGKQKNIKVWVVTPNLPTHLLLIAFAFRKNKLLIAFAFKF